MATIDCYASLNSPWTYLGCARLMDIAARHGCTVAVKPARFAQVFEKTGGLPLPRRSPERRAYRMMELRRWSENLSIPLVFEPAHFPADEAPGVRLMLGAIDRGEDALSLLREIGRAVWEREEDIGSDAVLAAAATRAGMDAAAILADAPSPEEAAERHEALTAQALAAGVFGAPSYVLPDGEIFWGQDRLGLLDWRLSRS